MLSMVAETEKMLRSEHCPLSTPPVINSNSALKSQLTGHLLQEVLPDVPSLGWEQLFDTSLIVALYTLACKGLLKCVSHGRGSCRKQVSSLICLPHG